MPKIQFQTASIDKCIEFRIHLQIEKLYKTDKRKLLKNYGKFEKIQPALRFSAELQFIYLYRIATIFQRLLKFRSFSITF